MDNNSWYFGDSMSLYKEYLKERENSEILETDYGFAIIRQVGDALYLQDIYVKPEYRQQGRGREMLEIVEETATRMGLTKVLGSCSPGANGSTNSLKAILACGFQLLSCDKDVIYLIKQIQIPSGAV